MANAGGSSNGDQQDGAPKSLWGIIAGEIVARFGRKGLIVVAILALLGAAYVKWESIKTWPGVSAVVGYLFRAPVPQADSEKLSVFVAHLANDQSGQFERIIMQALAEYDGIQVIPIDRTIFLSGVSAEEMEMNGHAEAREYLAESGASVLLWGEASHSAVQARWQSSIGHPFRAARCVQSDISRWPSSICVFQSCSGPIFGRSFFLFLSQTARLSKSSAKAHNRRVSTNSSPTFEI